ncbi:MAG: DEAD/DEAH box helicase family protein [Salinarimonas sp.]
MEFDFGKLSRPQEKVKSVDPIKIFRATPSLQKTPNDLWRSQSTALEEWFEAKEENDVLISLNTGAGKSIVGLLIAQSLVNQGYERVLYVCSTNDLVVQTAREANERLGLSFTLRQRGKFSNNLFETGKGFCITTYQALLNGKTKFKGDLAPNAIIFDDAHVSEKMIRDAFTITINKGDANGVYESLARLFEPHFDAIGRLEAFKNILSGQSAHRILAIPPGAIVTLSDQISEVFRLNNLYNTDTAFSLLNLEDKIKYCVAYISQNRIEICPNFLPSKSLTVFKDKNIKRIYLSATLNSMVDFCRAFGRLPTRKIEPESDAGNGERAFIEIQQDKFTLNGQNINDASAVAYLARQHKLLIATPSYNIASKYKSIKQPPSVENFTSELDDFRQADRGVFSLVSRVDGIDLPHNVCRVMLVDGLPTGFSLHEIYQHEHLNMRNSLASKYANRITQLFGRINRGRKDYSVIYLLDKRLQNWLSRDRNLALLPELLQKQILLGRSVVQQFKISSVEAASELALKILRDDPERDAQWLEFYQNSISGMELEASEVERATENEDLLVSSALAEADYAKALWEGDPAGARQALAAYVDKIVVADRHLAGSYNIAVGQTFELDNDKESAAKQYSVARTRILGFLCLPSPSTKISHGKSEAPKNEAHGHLLRIFVNDVRLENDNIAKLYYPTKPIGSSSSSNQKEEAIRSLGEMIGFFSSRPDHELEIGPDVLWICNDSNKCIQFELKTDKLADNLLNKDDIGQGYNHIRYVVNNYSNLENLGLIYVAKSAGCTGQSSPSSDMWLCTEEALASLRDEYYSWLQSLQSISPIERYAAIGEAPVRGDWSIENVFQRIKKKQLTEL